MNISAAHSIKYGVIGSSGSFVDFDKFTDSDLNFFISVKVTNQSISVKDGLVFQGLSTVNSEMFRSVFGDCFISGFLEGGELNALVSIKVLNKDKLTTVKAEWICPLLLVCRFFAVRAHAAQFSNRADIALSVGAADIKAPADVGIAKSDLLSQTETTIQVGWSGGGDIKPGKHLPSLPFSRGYSNQAQWTILGPFKLWWRPLLDSLISSPTILSVLSESSQYFLTPWSKILAKSLQCYSHKVWVASELHGSKAPGPEASVLWKRSHLHQLASECLHGLQECTSSHHPPGILYNFADFCEYRYTALLGLSFSISKLVQRSL